MFKRYTEKVRKVIMMAQEEAVNLNHKLHRKPADWGKII